MSYGLGIELTAAGAIAVADRGAGPGPAVHVAPTVAVDERGASTAGEAATRLAAARPSSAITDVIGQFPVPRLWLAGGRMITPDDALATVLTAIASQVSDEQGGPAGAVTIGCPPTWDADVRSRVVAAAATAGLARPECVPVLDGRRAAAHATARCPVAPTPRDAGPDEDLPALRPGFTARQPAEVSDAYDPTASKTVRGRRPVPALAVVLGAVLAFAAAVVATGQARSDSSRVEVTLVPGRSSPEPVPTTVPATERALTLGLITDGTNEAAVQATIAEINAVGGVLGQDVYLVVADATSGDPVAELTGQGVTAIVDDRVGGSPDDALGLATCTTGRAPERTGPVADAAGCVTFLSLASLAAGDTDGSRVRRAADDLAQRRGVDCTSFVQCRGLIVAGQPVTYLGLRSPPLVVRTPTASPQCPDRQPTPIVCPTVVPFRSPPTESPRP